jgi:ATP-dependent DNA helicase RecQ
MIKFSGNYSNTNHNFVIQNLLGDRIVNEYLSAICIVKNIIQRGCPTLPSKFLHSILGAIDLVKPLPLIDSGVPNWERIIRGDRKSNYFPAQKFFHHLIPKYFSDLPFLQQLLIPEVPINYITQIDVEEFEGRQVDFYLPQAFLVIEIDGSHHDAQTDRNRDDHFARFGIKTVRITTVELETENETFLSKVIQIKGRINQVAKLQEEKKKEQPDLISFADYSWSLTNPPNYNEPSYLATSIFRLQITLLELIEKGKLSFNDNWEIAVLCNEQTEFENIACDDLFLWFDNLFRLQRIPFSKPQVIISRVQSFEQLKAHATSIKIDFSLTKRYTDEFQNHHEIVFVRNDYFDHYRYYKNTNAVTPKYVGLKPYNHFQISTSELVNYKIQVGGDWKPENAFAFFLENIFGYKIFFQGQLPIIINALSRNDTIGLLPTGGGKSVCYQLAALLQPAISFVVCPIKSLMYDQKQDLDSIFFSRVHHITSDDDGEDKDRIMKEFAFGKFFFIFISPERFQIESFRNNLLSLSNDHKIAYAVIDEVHCLSEWGHDFRTSYLNLSKTIQKHCNDFRFIGLTATASINVLKDIQLEFGIKQENVKTLTDYTRKELDFEIIDDTNNKLREIKTAINYLNQTENVLVPRGDDSKCGIIFTPTVNGGKGCYNLSLSLEQEFRTPVKFYSGQVPTVNNQPLMNPETFEDYKKRIQLEFKRNEFTLLTATKAFGMGVNKGNIHYTIHYGIPGSMESLYQEAGRAGRDKSKFANEQAKCMVLFTKTTDRDLLQRIWARETTLSKLVESLPSIDGDINTNLFLFQLGLDIIKDEFELVTKLIATYALPSQRNVSVFARDIGANKSKTEKAIYRLSQLGMVEDWTVKNFFTGEFGVDFSDFSDETIKANLKETINKYDKDFDFDNLIDNDSYKQYDKIWIKEASLRDRCIVLLLQWAYDHFAYNRRQSLKNIYENCNDFISNIITKEEFKQRLENYFKFSEVSYLLQHIAENPSDFYRWFEIFYQVEDNIVSNEIINCEQRQSLLANLGRFLESYQYNTGLDFISGVLRLLIDDFNNADGKARFESSFKQIMKFDQNDFNFIFDKLLAIGATMSLSSKSDLATALLTFFPDNSTMLRKIHNAMRDDFTTGLLLSELTSRLINVNNELYGELIQIG